MYQDSSYRILDVVEAIAPNCETKTVGIRPGEKLHEEMITETDALNTIDIGRFYAILPTVSYSYSKEDFLDHYNGKEVPLGFSYNSALNDQWEEVKTLRKLIAEHVDSDFQV